MPGDQPVAERGLQRGGSKFESRLQAPRQAARRAADQFATIRKLKPLQLKGAVAGGQDTLQPKTMAVSHGVIAARKIAQTRFNVLPTCKGGNGKTRRQSRQQRLGQRSHRFRCRDRVIQSFGHRCDP
jgi:hypothetical protein